MTGDMLSDALLNFANFMVYNGRERKGNGRADGRAVKRHVKAARHSKTVLKGRLTCFNMSKHVKMLHFMV